MAEKADKFVCYQKSVQSADVDVAFFEQAYEEAYGGKTPVAKRGFLRHLQRVL